MTIGIPQIGDSVPWNEIPVPFNNVSYYPKDGIVISVDEKTNTVYVDVEYNHTVDTLVFDLDGSSWDETGHWKRDFQWGYQREQLINEQLDGFAQMG